MLFSESEVKAMAAKAVKACPLPKQQKAPGWLLLDQTAESLGWTVGLVLSPFILMGKGVYKKVRG